MPINVAQRLRFRTFPWKWMLRKKRVFLFVPVVLIFSVSLLILVLYIAYYRCSNQEIAQIIDIVCKRHAIGKSFGSLCSDLCITETLRPLVCVPNHLGKDVVFKAQYGKSNVIVKSAHFHTKAYDKVYWINDEGFAEYPSTSMFYNMLLDTVVHNLNIKDNSSVPKRSALIQSLWQKDMSDFDKLSASIRNAAMDDVWSLVQQTEYLMLKYLDYSNLFPKILGTCGSLYVEEFLKPVNNALLVLYPTWRETFKERAQIALTIINYLEEIETWFPGIQICDVKHDHFGVDDSGKMKLLDVDMVFYENALLKNMLLAVNCSAHEECSFLDCRGFCDMKSHSCIPVVKNTNFQRVCVKIFLGKFAPSYLGLLGLPPRSIAGKLKSLLSRCLFEMDAADSTALSHELKLLLLHFLQ